MFLDRDGVWVARGTRVQILDLDGEKVADAELVDLKATDRQGRPYRVVPPEEIPGE